MVRIAIILIAVSLASGAAADDMRSFPTSPEEMQRIDPAKTLLLIQRIKRAVGDGLVVS